MNQSALASHHDALELVLRDGSTLHLRPLQGEDVDALRTFVEQLGQPADGGQVPISGVQLPIFSRDRLAALSRLDDQNSVTLIGELRGRIGAVCAFVRDPQRPDVAQCAFAVNDTLRGKGLGAALLDRLAEAARQRGIRWLEGDVYATNHRMLNMIAASGFEVISRNEGGLIRARMDIEPTPAYEQRLHQREESTVAASVRIFFEPRSVAVIGASVDERKIGSSVLRNLITSNYTGRIYPINPKAEQIQGLRCFSSLHEVGHAVDLVVIAVPQPLVDGVVDECIATGVRGMVLLTAGYSETGPEGREREARLLHKLRSAGVRLIGPNCFGVINTDPKVRLNVSFATIQPTDGPVGLLTQSGALGQAILDYARHLNLGMSNFVSVGNKADISGNDLLQFWKGDERTRVILLYLESFGNPQKFSRLAREITRQKPIICVKAGRSGAGARAAASHTGSLAGSDQAVDALLRQCGVIRTTTLEELFDVATLLAHQPLPKGKRVAVLTNAGGPAIMAADACEANGLELPALQQRTTERLRTLLPEAASAANPVDMLASGSPEQYGKCLSVLLEDENVDAVLVLFVPLQPGSSERVAEAISKAIPAENDKPILSVFLSMQGLQSGLSEVPSYRFPEAAAIALAHAYRYAQWRKRPLGAAPALDDIDTAPVRAIVDANQQRGGWLPPGDVNDLLDAAGITAARAEVAATLDDAISTAQAIGYPIALKAIGPEIVHKTEVGGVKLNILNDEQLGEAYDDLRRRLGDRLEAVLVQQMVSSGEEMLIGATRDDTFGHIIAYGTGGTMVEVMRDVALRIAPITDQDALDMMNEVRGSQLLRGWRGSPPADEAAVREMLLRLSAMLELCPEIEEVDFNPIRVQQRGAVAVDARVRVGSRLVQPAAMRHYAVRDS